MEARALGFAVNPKLMAPLERMARRHLEKQVADPALRARLTPDYTIGCKRILLSSTYYPALQRPNVDLVTDHITEITETGVVTADGTAHPADVIIYGTGFKVVESVTTLNVAGRDGRKLTPENLEAYHGVTVAGFPNFFMLLGPNTGLGHTSVVFMIESQVQHVLSCLRILARERTRSRSASRPCGTTTTPCSGGCAAPCGARAAVTAGTSTTTASTGRCGRASPSSTGRAPAGLAAPTTP